MLFLVFIFPFEVLVMKHRAYPTVDNVFTTDSHALTLFFTLHTIIVFYGILETHLILDIWYNHSPHRMTCVILFILLVDPMLLLLAL